MIAEVERLNKELASEIVKVPASLHRHIIGRNGAQSKKLYGSKLFCNIFIILVNKLKEDNGVQISILGESANSDEIRIEGKKESVKKTVATIKEIVTRLVSYILKIIIIIQLLFRRMKNRVILSLSIVSMVKLLVRTVIMFKNGVNNFQPFRSLCLMLLISQTL